MTERDKFIRKSLSEDLAQDARATIEAALKCRESRAGRRDLEILYELCAERGILNSVYLPLLDKAENVSTHAAHAEAWQRDVEERQKTFKFLKMLDGIVSYTGGDTEVGP